MTRKTKRKQAIRIFLSYAADDRVQAHKLRNLLSRRPNVLIFTMEMLSAGEDWESKLKDELSKCDIFLVLLSPNSVDSAWVLHELGAAWAIGKHIIGVSVSPEGIQSMGFVAPHLEVVKIKDFEKPGFIERILSRHEEVATSH